MRTPRLLCLIFLVVMAVALTVRAAERSFWFDELATWEMVQLDGWSARVEALNKGADSQPSLFYSVEAAAAALPLPDEIAYRLPSIIGFLGGAAGLYVLVMLLWTEWAALAAVGFWSLTVVVPYALDARPYALWMGAAAWAMACFTGTVKYPQDRRWTVGLGASLSFAVAMHYFAITLLPPFLLAGLVYDGRRRKVSWLLWLMLAAPLLALYLELPLLRNFQAIYAPHFWTKVAGLTVIGWYLNTTLNYYAIAGLTALGLLVTVWWRWRERSYWKDDSWPQFPLAPVVLVLAVAALPIFARAAVIYFQFNIVPRYLVSVVPGIAAICGIASAGLIGRGRGALAPVALLVPVIAAGCVIFQPPTRWGGLQRDMGTIPFRQRLLLADPSLPVVASTGLDYLPWDHYERDPAFRSRLFAIVDEGLAVKYFSTDSIELALELLPAARPRQWLNLTLFLSLHPDFYAILRRPDEQWLERFLLEQKADVKIVASDGPWRLARVSYRFH